MIFKKNVLRLDSSYSKVFYKILIFSGNTLTLIGSIFLLLGLANLIRLDAFSLGLSSGVRMIGMVIITGCLFSAIGYGFLDFIEE